MDDHEMYECLARVFLEALKNDPNMQAAVDQKPEAAARQFIDRYIAGMDWDVFAGLLGYSYRRTRNEARRKEMLRKQQEYVEWLDGWKKEVRG
jgi:heme A synthase